MPTVLPDLSIRQLEYLVAVADAPSWAVAAARVGVSPSALSQGLAELERRVGLPLFDRQGRRRVLRADARPVLDHARQVTALTGDLARWADRIREGDEGRLGVGMIDAAAIHHHSDVMRRFRDAHRGLRLHLRVAPSGELLDELTAGELDLVVCVEPVEPVPGITVEPLLVEQLGVYRPDGRRAGEPASWGAWVLFPPGSHTRSVAESALRTLGAPVEVVAESHQPEVLREMVELGLGWTVLPVVQAESGDRPLVRARILTERRLVTAVRSGAATSPAAAALLAALRDSSRQGGSALAVSPPSSAGMGSHRE
ncbi:MAG: LysR family transcriptional regulator [Acidimicrobiales bacterium]